MSQRSETTGWFLLTCATLIWEPNPHRHISITDINRPELNAHISDKSPNSSSSQSGPPSNALEPFTAQTADNYPSVCYTVKQQEVENTN